VSKTTWAFLFWFTRCQDRFTTGVIGRWFLFLGKPYMRASLLGSTLIAIGLPTGAYLKQRRTNDIHEMEGMALASYSDTSRPVSYPSRSLILLPIERQRGTLVAVAAANANSEVHAQTFEVDRSVKRSLSSLHHRATRISTLIQPPKGAMERRWSCCFWWKSFGDSLCHGSGRLCSSS